MFFDKSARRECSRSWSCECLWMCTRSIYNMWILKQL